MAEKFRSQRLPAAQIALLIEQCEVTIERERVKLQGLKMLRKSLVGGRELSQREQRVWILRQQGWKMDDIAAEMGIGSKGTVSRIYQRTKQKMGK